MTGGFGRLAVTVVLLVCLVTTPVANTVAVASTPQAKSISLENTMLGGETTAPAGDSPTKASAPDPSLGVDAPREATVGDPFTITVVAGNDGGDAGEFSTISVSSPTLDSSSRARDITGVSTTLPYDAFMEPGDTIYAKGGESKEATATLVEGSVGGGGTWGAGDREQMTVEVTPSETGTYTFYVRTTLTDPADTEVKYTAPADGDAVDQQGYEVREITVEVTDGSDENRAPVIEDASPDGAVTTAPGEESDMFEVDASDPDGDDLSYRWIWWDDGEKLETFDDLGSDATFYWDQAGDYRIEVVVSDGEATTSHSWPFVIEDQTTEYDLSVKASPGGDVTISPPGETTTQFADSYAEGQRVELTANPDDGSTFTGWEGDVSYAQEDERTIEVTMDQARSLTATFEADANRAPEITRADPDGEVVTAPGEVADEFSVTASDPDGDDLTYTWLWWDDGEQLATFDDLGPDAEFHWDEPGEYRIEVVVSDGEATTSHSWPFIIEEEPTEYTLRVEATSGGVVEVTPPGVTTREFEQAYGDGRSVVVTAAAEDGYAFTGWEGDVSIAQEDDRTIEVTMDQARSLTATFEASENRAPEISRASPDGEVRTGIDEASDEFSVTASDPDGDDLTYTWLWWDDGEQIATFDDLGPDAEFHWDEPGEYRIEVVVSDGETSTSHSWPFIIEQEGGTVGVTATDVAVHGPNEATITGEITELGAASRADVYVEYRQRGASGWERTPADTVSDTGRISWDLDGLAPDTEYEIRFVVATEEARDTTRTLSFATESEDAAASSGQILHASLPEQYRENQVVWAYVRIRNPDASTQSYRVSLADDSDVSFPRDDTREITVPGNAVGLVKIPVRLTTANDRTTIDAHLATPSGKQLDTMRVQLSKFESPTIRERFVTANERLVAAIDAECWTLSEGCDSTVQREAAFIQYTVSPLVATSPTLQFYLQERRRNMMDADEQAAYREGILDGVSAAGVKTKEEVLGTVEAAKQFADSPIGFVVETAGNTKRAVAVAAEHPELVTKAMERALREKRDEIRAQSPYEVGTEEYEEYRAAWVQYYVSSRIAIMVAAGKGTGKVATKVKQGTKLGKSSIVGRIDANERLSGIYLRLYGDGYSMDRIQTFKTRATEFVARSSLKLGELRHVLDAISYVRERTGYTPKDIGDVAEAIYLQRVATMTGGTLVKSVDDIPRDEPGTYLLHSVRVGPEGRQAGELDVVQVEVTEAGAGTEMRVTKVYEVTQGQGTAATSKYFGGAGPDDAVKTKHSQLLTTLQDAKSGEYEIAKGLDASAFQHDDGVGSVIVGPSRWSGDSSLVDQGQSVKMEGPGRVGFGASLPYTSAEFDALDDLIEKSGLIDGYDPQDRLLPRSVVAHRTGHVPPAHATGLATGVQTVRLSSLRSRSVRAPTNGTVATR